MGHLLRRGDYFLSGMLATPGNSRPSRNSSEAPPPVEMKETLSETPAFFTAETESPPPMILIAPLLAAMALAMAKVPTAHSATSKTPMGPFHRMVLAEATSPEKSFTVSGPMSTPSQPSGRSEER